jgi:hypothetical protein
MQCDVFLVFVPVMPVLVVYLGILKSITSISLQSQYPLPT